MKVTVGISNRHVHLTREHVDILFGKDHELQVLRFIHQPGQFASVETVAIETPKNRIENVRVLGPIRSYTQVEISRSDAIHLGIHPPIRESGDIKGSAPITIIGPKGTIELKEGCIIANRHIHMTEQKRQELGLSAISKVCVRVDGEKNGILGQVYLKIADHSYFEMHLDTDDANAYLLENGQEVEILVEDE